MERYAVKMRAGRWKDHQWLHISGAERMVSPAQLEGCLIQMAQRALHHSKGAAQQIHIQIQQTHQEDILYFDALPVQTISVEQVAQGYEVLGSLLSSLGIQQEEKILSLLSQCSGMRGAILLHADTLERLEPDQARGVRATYMDYERSPYEPGDHLTPKHHFWEALALATKVAHAPGIVGELCISDDPDYLIGYMASLPLGYVRITKLKELGDPRGGRIFLFRGSSQESQQCIHYLEHQQVLIRQKGVVPYGT